MGFAESISLETVRQILKKTNSSRGKEWCIPEVSGEFVARMEDVLDLYHADYDPDHPVVCFDETSRQLVADKRPVGAKRVGWNDMETSETALETCSCSVSRKLAGGMSR